MNEIKTDARDFILKNARLLERLQYQVYFDGLSPSYVGRAVRAYMNPDNGLGHALEPDVRCSDSQPLFVSFGLEALEAAGCHDPELALSVCGYLKSIADKDGMVPNLTESAFLSPMASHWAHSKQSHGVDSTIGICGLLYFHNIRNDWLEHATAFCIKSIKRNPPVGAHELAGISHLAEYIPDKTASANLLDLISCRLPKANFYIADAPVQTYGLTPLHFAPKPESICSSLFKMGQIISHLDDLINKQLPDGGWPVTWAPPDGTSAQEWRGIVTLQALKTLAAYGAI